MDAARRKGLPILSPADLAAAEPALFRVVQPGFLAGGSLWGLARPWQLGECFREHLVGHDAARLDAEQGWFLILTFGG